MPEKSILVIGGSTSFQTLLSEAFAEYDQGAHVTLIDSMDEALTYLKIKSERKDAPPPHAIIINALMTNVVGCVLLRFIKENPWLVKVPHFVVMAESMIRLTDCPKEIRSCHLEEPNTWDEYAYLVKRVCSIVVEVWNLDDHCDPPNMMDR